MRKTLNSLALSLTAIILLNVTSCNNGLDEEIPARTPEMEIAELNNLLSTIEENGFDIDTTDLGIYYIVHTEGEGALAQIGDTLRLEYAAYFFDGKVLDASAYHYPDSIWEFIFIENQLISGFEDGILLMNKGAQLEMIIPSEHAYGATLYGGIEPYTPLIFAAKMHDINPTLD